jgi:hypothetical protein
MKVWNERLAIEIGGAFVGSNPLDQSSDGLCRVDSKFRPRQRHRTKVCAHGIDQLHLNWNVRIPGITAGDFNAQWLRTNGAP